MLDANIGYLLICLYDAQLTSAHRRRQYRTDND